MIWVCIGGGTLRELEAAFRNVKEIPHIDDGIEEIALGGFKALGNWPDIKFFMVRELKDADCCIRVIEEDIKDETIGSLIF